MQKSFMKSRFFKLPQHKRFDISPRYYDEQAERLNTRRKEIALELGLNENDEKIERELRIRDKFREHNNRPSFIGKSFWSNIRLIIIFMILLSIFYYLFLHLDDVMVSITGSK
tara:strand:+ start:576 stop:914 length:339 start_codon:yes stop_codon:yes gene_type:complete